MEPNLKRSEATNQAIWS